MNNNKTRGRLRTYKIFIALFVVLFALYVYTEVTKPKDVDWSVTLKQNDKNPYGAYILYNSLPDYFPQASIGSYRVPVYNQLTERDSTAVAQKSAYFLISPNIKLSKADVEQLLKFVSRGNYAFVASGAFSKVLTDTLGLSIAYYAERPLDSTYINFTNKNLKTEKGFTFRRLTINNTFKEIKKKDSVTILGATIKNKNPNFLKFDIGKGSLFVHSAPLIFSNLSYLSQNNADYANKAVSYIPADIKNIYWDEYYKQGRYGPQTPWRVLLSNFWTKWALYFGMILLLIYVFFGIKRKQRAIPVIKPLQNKSLQYAETIASLYYNKRENTLIAQKKLHYFTDFICQRYGIQMRLNEENFVATLAHKSGVEESIIKKIITQANNLNYHIPDTELEMLSKNLETFYQSVKA